jgi:hypothetical protein
MEDNFGKYIRLFGNIFFTVLGFIIFLVLLLLGFKLFFGLLSYIPWFVYAYMLIIITVPTALFVTVYLIYFKRSTNHVSKPVRIFSYTVFTAALIAWVIYFALDIRIFFTHSYNDIAHYNTYNLLFLSLNVGAIFLVGIVQALSSTREVDWMDRNKKDDTAA